MPDIGYRKAKASEPLLPLKDGLARSQRNKKCKWPTIVIIFWVITVILVIVICLVNFFELESFVSFGKIIWISKVYKLLMNDNNFLDGYHINTPGCQIPKMDPFDPTVNSFIYKPKEILCHKNLPPLFESSSNSLYIIRGNLHFYDVELSDVNCCYQEFWRETPRGGERDEQVSYSKTCFPLTLDTSVYLDKEFVKVTCKYKEQLIFYEDYFAFVPLKKETVPRTAWDLKPNVLILGLDAVSRLNLQRQFPKTYGYLTKQLGAIELLGYNKVEDNTFPNLLPVLKGMNEHELRKSCWPSNDSRFDNCTFLWDDFRKNDYITAFAEDCGHLGLFNYLKRGFYKQPTDYYFTGFNREMEHRIGHYGDGNCCHCVGGREVFKVMLDYIQKFVTGMSLAKLPYFGFFWETTLTHDYLNRAALGDSSYYKLLKYFDNTYLLSNTILVFMSDHGIRAGKIRETLQGQLEERLPFVFIHLPDWFKKEYPTAVKNLIKNKKALTTPFDLHETLKDLLDLDNLKNPGKIVNISRGYSLFRKFMSNRTCADAGIPVHWCTCQLSATVETNDKQVVAAADFAINTINFHLKGYSQCETLVIDSILDARILYYDRRHFTDEKAITDYNITLRTLPGEAVLGVTVRLKGDKHQLLAPPESIDQLDEDQSADISAPEAVNSQIVSGTQSYCITHLQLKFYCYCRK